MAEDPVDLMAKRLEGSNVSPQTFLATDYLNHFNEVVMLLGMLGDMPEMFEDIAAWRPMLARARSPARRSAEPPDRHRGSCSPS